MVREEVEVEVEKIVKVEVVGPAAVETVAVSVALSPYQIVR